MRVELEPFRVGQRRAGLHAQQHLVRLRVTGVRVVQVVADHRPQVQLLAELDQVAADPRLDVELVVHQFEEEVVRTEDVPVVGGGLARLVELADAQPGLDLAGRAAGRRDDPLGVPLQQLPVGARLVVVPLKAGQRPEPEQVAQPVGVLGEHRHVGVRPAAGDVVLPAVGPAHPAAVEPRGTRGEIGLDADDRLDAGRDRLLVEVVGAVQVAVVGHRQGRHAQPVGLGEQVLQPRRTVEHRVLGVDMQMYERVTGAHGGPA